MQPGESVGDDLPKLDALDAFDARNVCYDIPIEGLDRMETELEFDEKLLPLTVLAQGEAANPDAVPVEHVMHPVELALDVVRKNQQVPEPVPFQPSLNRLQTDKRADGDAETAVLKR